MFHLKNNYIYILKDEGIDSQVELDVFKFVYGALDIPELKESVKDTMGMVSEYSKERVYANLNLLSMITIPFILFSTLFQIGTIKLAPLFDWSVGNSSISAVAQWTLFLVIVVIVTVIIFFGRKKR